MSEDKTEADQNQAAGAAGDQAAGAAPFLYQRRVEWADTDAAGIAHYTSLLRYFEEAEHALLRAHGWSVRMAWPALGPEVRLSWPRRRVEAEFLSPAQFEQVLQIAVRVAQVGRTSVTYAFAASHGDRPVAQGRTVAICCQVEPGPLHAVPIPAEIRRALAP